MGASLYLAFLAVLTGADATEPPLVGRPVEVPFSEASAEFLTLASGELRCPFELTPSATPTTLRATQTLTYTITIRGVGKVHRPPVRFDLKAIPAFANAFFIEDVTEAKTEIAPATWRWSFRLRPKNREVRSIPGLPFVFYSPHFQPPEKGFQTLYTDPIALNVGEAEALETRPDAPDSMRVIFPGAAVLTTFRRWAGPTPWLTAVVLLGPAIPALAWLWLWRRLYPDAARRARLRQSRAGRRAIRTLAKTERAAPREQAERTTVALTTYLAERFDHVTAEPMAAEVRDWLRERGVAEDVAQEAADVLTQCATARFGPGEPSGAVAARARELVLKLELTSVASPA